ncbi:thiamine phosphate synthase [Verrucomicrobiota bacterium]
MPELITRQTIEYHWDASPAHNERMLKFIKAGVYLVTSQSMSAGRTTLEIVQSALMGGIRLIQLREKDLPETQFKALAGKVKSLTDRAEALLLINDRLDAAIETGADGVHLGQDDLPVNEAREQTPDLIIGASTHSVEEAVKAQADGASYVNIGPIFPTQTKEGCSEFLGIEAVKEISSAITIPFTVMGGIKENHIPDLISAGARVIAIVTAITAAENPGKAAETLINIVKNG